MTDSMTPAHSSLAHGVQSFKKRGKVPPGIIGRRRVLMNQRALKTALEAARPDRTPQIDLLIRQIVWADTILTLGFNWFDRIGILRQSSLRRGDIEFQPIFKELISAMNTQRLAILALGLDQEPRPEPSLADIIAQIDKEKGNGGDGGEKVTDGTRERP